MSGDHWLIVVAAGRGERLGLGYNKVFHPLAGRSVLSRCFDALMDADCYCGAVLVLSASDIPLYEWLTAEEGAPALVRAVASGGQTRQESVRKGLALVPDGAATISIHDAARAFVPKEVLRDTLMSAIWYGTGVAATELTDTVKRLGADGRAVETLDRSALRAVQTPQAFRAEVIRRAHAMADADGYEATDDAALVEKYHGAVRLCVSAAGRHNVKLTTMEDLAMMEARLGAQDTLARVGQGYDVHRLVEGRRLVLCGVDIPFERGLDGHSDADVATHALMDALLGACAMGDIGRHFPDTDPQYKGASSVALLRAVARKMRDGGFAPVNADVTVVCERPKIAGHIDAMREALATALGIEVSCVNVKATTTEGLGFTGREEGIAAHAIAQVLPRGHLFL